MSGMFGHLRACVYTNGPKKDNTEIYERRGYGATKKAPSKEDKIDKTISPIILIKSELKILAKSLAKELARVMIGLVREAETPSSPGYLSSTVSTLNSLGTVILSNPFPVGQAEQ